MIVQPEEIKPLILVIFGASGDLARRKLIPAVYDLFKGDLLPDNFVILGVSRSKLSDDDFREKAFLNNELFDVSGESEENRTAFAKKLFYQPIDTNDEADYAKVGTRLEELNKEFSTEGNYIFYLSTPPMLYEKIPAYLSAHGLNACGGGGYRRLVIEKPFGYDLKSAQNLNRSLKSHFPEEEILSLIHI